MKMLKNSFILLLSVFTITSVSAQYASVDVDVIESSMNTIDEETINYDALSKILRKNASVLGAINYTGFKKDYKQFDIILKELAATNVKTTWSRKAQLAYWINVYNAYSIKLIADHFPAKNLSDIGKVEKIKFFEINNEMMSLNDVEDIIKDYNDVRALLVLHKGAVSGVKMGKNAYTAENLETTLEKRVRVFINDSAKNDITVNEAHLSDLIKTYKREIEKEYASVKEFVSIYSKVSMNYGQKIDYLPFNDTINSYQEAF